MMSATPDHHASRFGPWTAGLEAVALSDLNTAAALQTRVDRKYLIARTALDAVADDLTSSVRVLEMGSQRHFGYRSTYFDTDELGLFFDAARRRPLRFKVRVRTYVDSETSFLEVKTKSRRGETVKTRIATAATSHDRLPLDGLRFVVDTLGDQFGSVSSTIPGRVGRATTVAQLRPTLVTEYQRTTLLVADRSRATIDHALNIAMDDRRSHRFTDHVIVETKSSARPSMIDRMLWDRGHRPVAFSKYGTGLVLLNPELPGSKWNRVLRHELDWVPAPPGRSQPSHS